MKVAKVGDAETKEAVMAARSKPRTRYLRMLERVITQSPLGGGESDASSRNCSRDSIQRVNLKLFFVD